MMNLLRHFNQYIDRERLFAAGDRLLVAVSGGVDSVVLCHLLAESGYAFEIAHANFGLRGEESERDENFCRSLAGQLNVTFHTRRFDTAAFAEQHKLSVQVAARQLRYDWFDALLHERRGSSHPLRFLVTAHHANDNAETILFNVFRGTGLAGMRGIPPGRDNLRRPLLFAFRSAIVEYAYEKGLTWVEDSSNITVKYTRNYIRHEVIPVIERQFPALMENLRQSAEHFRHMEQFYSHAMDRVLKKLVLARGNEQQVPVEGWRRLPGAMAVLHAWLQPFGFSAAQTQEAAALADSQTGHYIASATHVLLRNRNWLVLTPRESDEASIISLEGEEGSIRFRGGNFQWKTISYQGQSIPTDNNIAWLDAADIAYPLLLRTWKAGDYFYPLGMPKKKKLARFFIDEKLSRIEKERTWVLESDKHILWVVGRRIDDRFKVKPSTRRVLVLQLGTG